MFADQIAQAIDAAHGGRHLDELSRLIWRGLSEGQITEDAAQGLAERIHTRRMLNSTTSAAGAPHRPQERHTGRPSIFPPRRPQRPPHRPQAIERRRRVAASGFAPPAISARFTTAEQAVLAIVVDEHRRRGDCRQPIDAIAARAGCSRSSVKNAIRAARAAGLIRVTPRPRRGQKHLPNIVEVIDPAWRTWIRKRGNRRIGDRGQNPDPHEKQISSLVESERVNTISIANRCTDARDSVHKSKDQNVTTERRAEMGFTRSRRDGCASKESSTKTKF
ncbi:MAG: helix-turn-helix domain-containing protein [Oceanicaulis sp.]|nr:helix-turn-helix domain-containing protein [Oceanicaulis sp.]